MKGFLLFLSLLALVALTIFGVYVSLHIEQFFPSKKPAPVEESAPVKPEKPKEVPKPLPPAPVDEPEPEPIEIEPPKKTVAEMQAEAEQARRELAEKIAAARKESTKELPGFAGVKFGEVAKGSLVRREILPDGGIAVVKEGKPLKKPFRNFGRTPQVWVTPKTMRIFRIEFLQEVKATGEGPAADTTNTVAVLEKKFKRSALSIDVEKFPMAEREYIFPFGETTLKVGEYGGGRLVLMAEDAKLRSEVKEESDAMQDEVANVGVRTLLSNKYPNGGVVKAKRAAAKGGTPPSFCGVVFGTSAPYGAVKTNPAKGAQGFYLDYRKAKLVPFMGFAHGKAEVSPLNGGVCAVRLYSDGSADGLSDEEYCDRVQKLLAKAFKQPRPTEGSKSMSFTVGDLHVEFGPDPHGGFALSAVNPRYR